TGARQPAAPSPPRRPSRRILGALGGGVLAAIVAVVVLTSGGGGGGNGSGSADNWTPDWCKATTASDTAQSLGAREAVDCDVPASLASSDVHGAATTFARYASAGEARKSVTDSRDFLINNQSREACDAATTQRLSSAYHAGRAVCLFRPSSREYWIGWNDDGSDVTGFATFASPTTGADSVDTFQKMVGA
ncbi:MAG: hypothetical protein JWR63_1254, partial [Conexibacter sp.]|nr:hypothetical protein [Conexibacter sp.]